MESFPLSDGGKARDQAAERVGVSGKSVDMAEAIIKKGVPKLATFQYQHTIEDCVLGCKVLRGPAAGGRFPLDDVVIGRNRLTSAVTSENY
ncbi:MAG: hypothetical protein ABIN37_03645 [Burkholderiaceae bacterium]